MTIGDELKQLEKKSFDKNWYWLIITMTIAMILYSVEQVVCNGVETWLPWWIVGTKDWCCFDVLDGFHQFKAYALVAFFAGGWFVKNIDINSPNHRIRLTILLIGIWFAEWQVFNLFYETIWRIWD